jgi:hypothetical protein
MKGTMICFCAWFYYVLCYRIDSEHNRKIVEKVIKEVGTVSFSSKQIRGHNIKILMSIDMYYYKQRVAGFIARHYMSRRRKNLKI